MADKKKRQMQSASDAMYDVAQRLGAVHMQLEDVDGPFDLGLAELRELSALCSRYSDRLEELAPLAGEEATVWLTSAEEAYDGFGTTEVTEKREFRHAETGKPMREVAILDRHLGWQIDRYRSGLELSIHVSGELPAGASSRLTGGWTLPRALEYPLVRRIPEEEQTLRRTQ